MRLQQEGRRRHPRDRCAAPRAPNAAAERLPISTFRAEKAEGVRPGGAGVPFSSFDILTDEEIRQGLKEYSDWPTYPQLYARGELVGGCDIVIELKEKGELKQALQ